MAKTKPPSGGSGAKKKYRARGEAGKRPDTPPEQLHLKASEYLYQLQAEKALPLARKALERYQEVFPHDPQAACPALLLLGQIYLSLGEVDLSQEQYRRAAEVDPDGKKTGAAPFLWLAQLSEEGGENSIGWFERACAVLRRELRGLEGSAGSQEVEDDIRRTRRELGEALCSMTEVYMTDLSFDPEAGAKCGAIITEAVLVSPESPAVLQTLASVRISEVRVDDAKAALIRSMELWRHLPPYDADIPDFAARISLTRLLLEVEMEAEAVEVVHQLVQEDDQSVEALYLGAWARFLLYERGQDAANESRDWFRRCLRLYTSLDYEDEKMRQHVVEMMANLDEVLGPPTKEEADDEADWEDAEQGEEEEGEEEDIEVEDDKPDVDMHDGDTNGAMV